MHAGKKALMWAADVGGGGGRRVPGAAATRRHAALRLQFVTGKEIDNAPVVTFLWTTTFPLSVRLHVGGACMWLSACPARPALSRLSVSLLRPMPAQVYGPLVLPMLCAFMIMSIEGVGDVTATGALLSCVCFCSCQGRSRVR